MGKNKNMSTPSLFCFFLASCLFLFSQGHPLTSSDDWLEMERKSDTAGSSTELVDTQDDPRWGLKLGCDVNLDGFREFSAMGYSSPRMNGAYKVKKNPVTGAAKMVNGKKSYYGPGSFGSMAIEWFPVVNGQPGWVLMTRPDAADHVIHSLFIGEQAKDDWLMYCHTSQNLDQLHGVTGTCTWKFY